MFVDEVVELVLPPFPPLEKLSASTAVPGTRSKGSDAAPATAVVSRAPRARGASIAAVRLAALLNMGSPFVVRSRGSEINLLFERCQNLFFSSSSICAILVRLTRQSTRLIDESVENACFEILRKQQKRLDPVEESEGDDAEIALAARPARRSACRRAAGRERGPHRSVHRAGLAGGRDERDRTLDRGRPVGRDGVGRLAGERHARRPLGRRRPELRPDAD